MASRCALCLLLLLFVATVRAQDDDCSAHLINPLRPASCLARVKDDLNSSFGQVLELTSANFSQLVRNEVWLINFYLPWCPFSKELLQIWDQLAIELSKNQSTVHVAKINCATETDLASMFQIRAFPSIKYIRGGQFRSYAGEPTLEDLQLYAQTSWQEQKQAYKVPENVPFWFQLQLNLFNTVNYYNTENTVAAAIFTFGTIFVTLCFCVKFFQKL